MGQRALVYKTGSTAESHVYVGQMEFSSTLSVAGSNSYLHNGARQVVHIDRIELHWLPTGKSCLPSLSARSPRRNCKQS